MGGSGSKTNGVTAYNLLAKEGKSLAKEDSALIDSFLGRFTQLDNNSFVQTLCNRAVIILLAYWVTLGFDGKNPYFHPRLVYQSEAGSQYVISYINATTGTKVTHYNICAPSDGGDCEVMFALDWLLVSVVWLFVTLGLGYGAWANWSSKKAHQKRGEVFSYTGWVQHEFTGRHLEQLGLFIGVIMWGLKYTLVVDTYDYWTPLTIFMICCIISLIFRGRSVFTRPGRAIGNGTTPFPPGAQLAGVGTTF
jgi:hypothetical protein